MRYLYRCPRRTNARSSVALQGVGCSAVAGSSSTADQACEAMVVIYDANAVVVNAVFKQAGRRLRRPCPAAPRIAREERVKGLSVSLAARLPPGWYP